VCARSHFVMLLYSFPIALVLIDVWWIQISRLVDLMCNAHAEPTARCNETVCLNGGVCVQQWNTATCDCDMTSFTGPRCDHGMHIHRYHTVAKNSRSVAGIHDSGEVRPPSGPVGGRRSTPRSPSSYGGLSRQILSNSLAVHIANIENLFPE